jgi:uncharacterized protein YndB with AHSA1/START domain
MKTNTDVIEKIVELKSPVARVWKALTDHREFGEWFRVALDQPFEEGGKSTGHITYPGYEHLEWLARVEKMSPQTYFAIRWHDYDERSSRPIAEQPTTLVEFELEAIDGGTRLTIRESGFDALGDVRGREARRRNSGGWDTQLENIARYVDG